MWSQDDSGYTMNWEEALAYVQELNEQNYLGYSDWYLPNAKELQSIVDYTRSPDATGSAAIDPMFHCTQITNEAGQVDWGYYWTSTTHVTQRGGQDAVYIAFGRGLGYMNGQFMDVHGAGCQRSDPKAGEPSHGFGPQGDVRRVDNFVRVVRADGSSTVGVGESETEVSLSPVGDVETVGVTDDQDQDFVLYAPLRGDYRVLDQPRWRRRARLGAFRTAGQQRSTFSKAATCWRRTAFAVTSRKETPAAAWSAWRGTGRRSGRSSLPRRRPNSITTSRCCRTGAC